MATRANRSYTVLAFAVSVALHAILLLLLLAVSEGPALHRPEAPIAVQLIEVPRSSVRGSSTMEGERNTTGRGGAAQAAPTSAQTLPRPSRPGRRMPERGPLPERRSDAWLAAEGLGRPEPQALPGQLSLVPGEIRDGLAGGMGPDQDPARDPSAPEDPVSAGQRAKNRLDAYFIDLKAANRAETPDVYWSNVRERLAGGFKVDWNVLDESRTVSPIATGRQLRELLKDYSEKAARYGATGNPYGMGPDVPGARRSLADDVRDLNLGSSGLSPTARGLLDDGRPENTLWHTRLTTLVLISQNGDGSILSIDLKEGSGNRSYDRLVLSRARVLAEDAQTQLGPPPAQGRKTLWAFNTDFRLRPPVPVLTCTFNNYFLPDECFWPLKRTVKSDVKLQAVY